MRKIARAIWHAVAHATLRKRIVDARTGNAVGSITPRSGARSSTPHACSEHARCTIVGYAGLGPVHIVPTAELEKLEAARRAASPSLSS